MSILEFHFYIYQVDFSGPKFTNQINFLPTFHCAKCEFYLSNNDIFINCFCMGIPLDSEGTPVQCQSVNLPRNYFISCQFFFQVGFSGPKCTNQINFLPTSRCAEGEFYSSNDDRCIDCFSMGIPLDSEGTLVQCQSANLPRHYFIFSPFFFSGRLLWSKMHQSNQFSTHFSLCRG